MGVKRNVNIGLDEGGPGGARRLLPIQPSPWLAISNKQLELMHKYLGDLGLSPVSRTRVSTTSPPGPKPWQYGLRQGSKFDGLLGGGDIGRPAIDPIRRSAVRWRRWRPNGIPEDDIGRVIGIDPKTLRKHYRDELDLGARKANAQAAGFLFAAAKAATSRRRSSG